jgi:hypothetical protein
MSRPVISQVVISQVLHPCEESKCRDRDEACGPTVLTGVAMRQSRRLANRAIFMSRNSLPTAAVGRRSRRPMWEPLVERRNKILPELKHADQFGVLS